jgi:hypothetical protein
MNSLVAFILKEVNLVWKAWSEHEQWWEHQKEPCQVLQEGSRIQLFILKMTESYGYFFYRCLCL